MGIEPTIDACVDELSGTINDCDVTDLVTDALSQLLESVREAIGQDKLYQAFQNGGHPDDWEQTMGPGGALEALVEARQNGLVRSIGVTGHGWNIAAMMIQASHPASCDGPQANSAVITGAR